MFGAFDGDMFWSGLTLAQSHGNPLESLKLDEVLKGLLTADQLDALAMPWRVVFWVLFMGQNAMVLYLLFQLGAAIRNKVKR
jgi:hypothetical protein